MIIAKNNLTHIYPIYVKLQGMTGQLNLSEIIVPGKYEKETPVNNMIRFNIDTKDKLLKKKPLKELKLIQQNNGPLLLNIIQMLVEPFRAKVPKPAYLPEEMSLVREHSRTLRFTNTGSMSVNVSRVHISNSGCEKMGFFIKNCSEGFEVKAGKTKSVHIYYSPDFVSSLVREKLVLETDSK